MVDVVAARIRGVACGIIEVDSLVAPVDRNSILTGKGVQVPFLVLYP